MCRKGDYHSGTPPLGARAKNGRGVATRRRVLCLRQCGPLVAVSQGTVHHSRGRQGPSGRGGARRPSSRPPRARGQNGGPADVLLRAVRCGVKCGRASSRGRRPQGRKPPRPARAAGCRQCLNSGPWPASGGTAAFGAAAGRAARRRRRARGFKLCRRRRGRAGGAAGRVLMLQTAVPGVRNRRAKSGCPGALWVRPGQPHKCRGMRAGAAAARAPRKSGVSRASAGALVVSPGAGRRTHTGHS